jgi:hypothetical protein
MSTEEKKVSLRNLDDVACSNVIVTRQIAKMLRKFPSMRELAIDCFTNNEHYVKFTWLDGKPIQWTDVKGCVLNAKEDFIYKEDLNKLLVYTYRAMCDNQDSVDLIDTPEDLLAFAESKLQEMLKEAE